MMAGSWLSAASGTREREHPDFRQPRAAPRRVAAAPGQQVA